MEDCKNLYEVLGVDKDATQDDVKKAYRRLAVLLHPDKNQGSEESKDKFQSLQRIYSVLGDPEKRKLYDATGSLQECEELGGSSGSGFAELYRYYRDMFRSVTEDDIAAFAAKYRWSDEERRELLDLYTRHSGNMAKLFDFQLLSRPELDSHRFMEAIDAAIEAGEVARTKAYTKWARQVASKPRPQQDPLAPEAGVGGGSGSGPAKAAGTQKAGGGAGGMGALVAAIQGKRQHSFAGKLAEMEARYCGSSGGGKKQRRGGREPTDEEFEAVRARLGAGAGSRGAGGSGGRGTRAAGSGGAAGEGGGKAARRPPSGGKGGGGKGKKAAGGDAGADGGSGAPHARPGKRSKAEDES